MPTWWQQMPTKEAQRGQKMAEDVNPMWWRMPTQEAQRGQMEAQRGQMEAQRGQRRANHEPPPHLESQEFHCHHNNGWLVGFRPEAQQLSWFSPHH